jgi:hypothetical protein
MRTSNLILSSLAISSRLITADVTDCALPCMTNLNGSNCTASNWPCLCASTWVEQSFNPCVVQSCNKTSQETTFQAFAQICYIFDIPLTASAEATFPASILASNATSGLSALGPGPESITSLPPVTSAASTMGTSTTPASASGNSAGGTTASNTGTASATGTPSAGNVGEQSAWFAIAVLLLAGAAVL